MLNKLSQSAQYAKLCHEHVKKTIKFLQKESCVFDIIVDVDNLTFTPQIPAKIYDIHMQKTIRLSIEGYTFYELVLKEEDFSFLALFGEVDFETEISLSYLAVKAIFVEQNLILVNISDMQHLQESKEQAIARSREALLKNLGKDK